MKRKIRFIAITFIAFLISFGAANYFSKNSVSLPTVVNQTVYWFESLFDKELEPSTGQVSSTKSGATAKQQYQHVEVGNAPVCRDTSLGNVKYKKVGEVYTWTDENGTPHFSDTPPDEGDYTQLNYAGEKILDYFTLDLNTESLPYDFNQKLTAKLNKLFDLYGKLLDTSSLKKADINLQVIANKATYQNIQKAHNMAIGNQSNGFFSHASNKAYLLYINDEQAMQTAIHEATHAINRAVIGYTHKWLNEGLAEYSESIDVVSKVARVYPSKNWTHNGIISEKLLPLEVLFSAERNEWNGKFRQKLYATSWAFIYFMMENSNRKAMISRVINTEQVNICDVMKKDSLESLFGLPIADLQRQFNKWSKGKLKTQSI